MVIAASTVAGALNVCCKCGPLPAFMLRLSDSVKLYCALSSGASLDGAGSLPRGFLPVSRWAWRAATLAWPDSAWVSFRNPSGLAHYANWPAGLKPQPILGFLATCPSVTLAARFSADWWLVDPLFVNREAAPIDLRASSVENEGAGNRKCLYRTTQLQSKPEPEIAEWVMHGCQNSMAAGCVVGSQAIQWPSEKVGGP